MAFGLAMLKLTPAAFWGMTMKELAAVVRGLAPEVISLGRPRLAELMDRFPDGRTKR